MTAHRADRADTIYNFVYDFTQRYGHGPTIREVMSEARLASPSAAYFHLLKLERQGDIRHCSCGCRRFIPVMS